MRSVFLHDFVLFPIPNKKTSRAISAHQVLSVGAKVHFARVTGNNVPRKLFLLLQRESVSRLKDSNGIVKTLSHKSMQRRMHHETRHGVHRWIGNVLDGHTNIPFPNENLLIITTGHHFGSVIFNEYDGINGCQVVVVLLRDFRRRGVVGDNLVVTATHHKQVIVVRIKLDDVRYFLVCKCLKDFSAFCFPQT